MNIIFLGSMYVNSTSRGIASVITQNPEVSWAGFIETFGFIRKYCLTYNNRKVSDFYQDRIPFPLSYYWKVAPTGKDAKFDVMFVEQNGFRFYNDLGIPVIYYHRDIPTPLFMTDMDILLYRFKKMEEIIEEENPKLWSNGIYKKRFLNAVGMNQFEHNLPKIYEGINWIGWEKPFEFYWNMPEQKAYYEHVKVIVDYARKNFLINYHPHGIAYSEAKRILQQSEAVLIIPGNEAYVTRKIYEAAVAKTMVILYIQNSLAEQIFKEIGLKHGVNCIMFSKKEALKGIALNFNSFPKEEIIKNAYNWVKDNHTWAHRAKELIEICKENDIG